MINATAVLVLGLGPDSAVIHGQWAIGGGYFWGKGLGFLMEDLLQLAGIDEAPRGFIRVIK